jgi:DNA-binding NarL/FixJ family response regulator
MKTLSAQLVAFPYRTAETRFAEHGLRAAPRLAGDNRSAAVHLTPRQREVLALLCLGLSNKLICRRLNICGGTVKVHISSIFRELGVATRLQAVIEAHRLGLDVPTPDMPATSAGTAPLDASDRIRDTRDAWRASRLS